MYPIPADITLIIWTLNIVGGCGMVIAAIRKGKALENKDRGAIGIDIITLLCIAAGAMVMGKAIEVLSILADLGPRLPSYYWGLKNFLDLGIYWKIVADVYAITYSPPPKTDGLLNDETH